jgi:hypothetical protein
MRGQEDELNLFLDRPVDNTKMRAGLSIEKAGLIFDSQPTILSETKGTTIRQILDRNNPAS